MKRFIAIFMTLCLVLGISSISAWADGETWQEMSPMTSRNVGLAAVSVGDYIYVIGGASVGKVENTLEIYNTKTNTWTAGAPMPTARWMLTASVIGDNIYVIGGSNKKNKTLNDAELGSGVNTLEIYNTKTNTWTAGAPMPTARYSLTSCSVGGKIYAIGGRLNTDNNSYTEVVEVYAPETDTWTTGTSMPTKRGKLASSSIGDNIYVIGGIAEADFSNALEVYNTKTDTWSIGTPMSTKRAFFQCTSAGNKIYAIGGQTIITAAFNTVEVYDPKLNSWVPGISLPLAIAGGSSTAINGRIYVTGGCDARAYLNSIRYLDVEDITIKISVLLNEGEVIQLSTSYNLANNVNYTWSSTDESVATVDSNGKVTAVAVGEVDIYAESADGTFKEYIPVKVLEAADEQRLAVHLKAGEKAKLYLTDDASAVTWSSMDESTVTVSADGQIAGVKKGLAIVQAELDGQTYQIYVRVNG